MTDTLKPNLIKINNNIVEELTALSEAFDKLPTVEDSFNETAIRLANIFQVEKCSIVIFKGHDTPKEDNVIIHTSYENEINLDYSVTVEQHIARHVMARGKSIFFDDTQDTDSSLAKEIANEFKGSFLASPLVIDNEISGVIILYCNANQFSKEDFEFFKVVTLFVSKAVKSRELQNILNSRYAQWAMVKRAKNEIFNPVIMAIQDPEGLSKLLARTFFKEMNRACFSHTHIINAASEIISLLHEKLKSYKDRLQ